MIFLMLSLAALQPAPSITNAPAERSEAQAALDVCLYTPAEARDPACQPILEAEAVLVPDEAFAAARPTALAWADVACTDDRLGSQTRTACRDEQRGLFRRAERARQALSQDSAGDVYAEALSRPPAAASDVGEGLAFSREERSVSGPCEQRSSASRDQDTGDETSSHSFRCSWSSDGDSEAARQVDDWLDRDD